MAGSIAFGTERPSIPQMAGCAFLAARKTPGRSWLNAMLRVASFNRRYLRTITDEHGAVAVWVSMRATGRPSSCNPNGKPERLMSNAIEDATGGGLDRETGQFPLKGASAIDRNGFCERNVGRTWFRLCTRKEVNKHANPARLRIGL